MVSVKSSTNMMMMTFGADAVVGVLWVLFGFSMVFGTSYGGFVGSLTEFAGMKDLLESQTTISGLPVSLFSLFQALFAAITVALISLSAFFVAVEFALIAARRSRLEDAAATSASARAALRSASELSLLLAGSQLGITACTLMLGAITKPAVHHAITPWLRLSLIHI